MSNAWFCGRIRQETFGQSGIPDDAGCGQKIFPLIGTERSKGAGIGVKWMIHDQVRPEHLVERYRGVEGRDIVDFNPDLLRVPAIWLDIDDIGQAVVSRVALPARSIKHDLPAQEPKRCIVILTGNAQCLSISTPLLFAHIERKSRQKLPLRINPRMRL